MDRFDWLEIAEEPEASGEQQAVLARPQDGPSYYAAARRMRQAGHFRSAVTFYEKCVGFDSYHYAAWVELIDTLIRARQVQRADEVSRQVFEENQKVHVLYASRGLVLLHQAEKEEAKRYIKISLEGHEPWYGHCIQAERMLRKGPEYRKRTVAQLEKAVQIAEDPWDALFVGGWMLLDAGLPTYAAGFFAEAAHTQTKTPISWLCLGDCFRDLKLYDQALFYYQKVTELEPKHPLGLMRQKDCTPKLFGLLRIFNSRDIKRRWDDAFK